MQQFTYESPHLAVNVEREWLLTNGLGGFASGTVGGVPSRRYHAWLIAATSAPVGRVVALHSCVETAILHEGAHVDFTSYQFTEWGGQGQDRPGMGLRSIISPSGANNLRQFRRVLDAAGGQSRWMYRPDTYDLQWSRTLMLRQGENACDITYELSGSASVARMEIRPFVPMRDFHALCAEHNQVPAIEAIESSDTDGHSCRLLLRLGDFRIALNMAATGGTAKVLFHESDQWWKQLYYYRDSLRGQESKEDLPSAGCFSLTPSGQGNDAPLTFTLSCELEVVGRPRRAPTPVATALTALAGAPSLHLPPAASSQAVMGARQPGVAPELLPSDRAMEILTFAAGQFVVGRDFASGQRTTIIAGYPWFSDWGRDACIALPGLLLATGRLHAARQCLESFAAMIEGGLIPNCFDNGTGRAEYNSADAPLWFVHAACQLSKATGLALDPSGEFQLIAGACMEIVSAYERGTAFDIRVDSSDGLVCAGSAGTQLTWMDAKRDGVVFTPRHGKPVELSALWYNALRSLAECLPAPLARKRLELIQLAAQTRESFERAFWNGPRDCLYDCLTPVAGAEPGSATAWLPSPLIRPNQVFALSLPFSPLDPARHPRVLAVLKRDLLTAFGLRTLAPSEPGYEPRYEGSLFSRDRAYHNGTVWPWLLGPYCEAVLRVGAGSDAARREAAAALAPLLATLTEDAIAGTASTGADGATVSGRAAAGAIASIAEVYDAQSPFRPDGCPAQAWSVAETLRVAAMIRGEAKMLHS